ncbi:MAG: GNAT family N-acetyltransferase, partial [Candidatus Hodarchaeales archaeon]
EGISGRDGAGQANEEELGYIKALFVQKGCDEELKRSLLEKALEFLQSKGKNKARVGEYTGPHFFPGIDTKYEDELRFYKENGFKEIEFEEDVSFNLISFKPTAYQDRMKKRVTEMGVVIEAYRPEYLGKMRDFVEKVNFPDWFPPGWDFEFGNRNYPLVALLENVIVGWSSFFKSPERWWFGPIAVLEEFGRKGIGTSLLLESMLQLKALEAQDVTAGWANVPFYLKSDWEITRRYIIFQKDL